MFLTFSIQLSSIDDFLTYWSTRYFSIERDVEKYDPYIGQPLTETSRRELFEWKNGSKLSSGKQSSVKQNYPLSFDKEKLAARYLSTGGGGAIWNIFYMHIIDPKIWPIYDQHTHRAMRYMKTGKIEEISTKDEMKYQCYLTEYIPFVRTLGKEDRKIDRALYSFGQFLKKISRFTAAA